MCLRSHCFLRPALTWDLEAFLHLPLFHLWVLEVLSMIRFGVIILQSTIGSSGCCENSRHAQTPFFDFTAWLPYWAHPVALRYQLNAKIPYIFSRNMWFHRDTFWTTVLSPRAPSHSSLRRFPQPALMSSSSHWVSRGPKLHSPNTGYVSRPGRAAGTSILGGAPQHGDKPRHHDISQNANPTCGRRERCKRW